MINGVNKRLAIAKEQITELSATMLSSSNEQQIFVQTNEAKHLVYVVLIHRATIPYSADLHADFPKRTFIEHAATVRHRYSVFIAAAVHRRVRPAM